MKSSVGFHVGSSFSVLSAETFVEAEDLKECRRECPKPPQQAQSRVAIPRKGLYSRNQYKTSLKEHDPRILHLSHFTAARHHSVRPLPYGF